MKYEIEIVRKNNKNTYIRVKEGKVIVTTSLFMPKYEIDKLIKLNETSINKMIEREEKKIQKDEEFFFLNNSYDIIIMPTIDEVEIDKNRIFIKNKEHLEKWIKKQTTIIFDEELKKIYNLFEEQIPYPKLKIRKMKSRWGVCNKNGSITLNSELIKYKIEEIDYVIVHELSHFVYFNHSKEFWNLVSKYCPEYKKSRKNLKY